MSSPPRGASLSAPPAYSVSKPRLVDRARRELFLRGVAAMWREGVLEIVLPGGEIRTFGTNPAVGRARMTVRDERFFGRAIADGGVGVGESYVEGEWTADDLPTVIALFCLNRARAGASALGYAARWKDRLLHALRGNSRAGARRNISAHYDLGNDFYRLWLDETMAYSCALFAPGDDLRAAQERKYARLAELLDLKPGHRVVEIGTGWGGFAIWVARRFDVRIVTTTISREQHALATERVREAGLADRVTVLDRDFRDLEGSFDRLVSIEMFEAIGRRNFEPFFAQCAALLTPTGRAVVQIITMPDDAFEAYARNVDWIQKYVFPGALVPSTTAMLAAASRSSDLRLRRLEDIGAHYAPTLAAWRQNFFSRLDDVRRLGFDDRFIRLWDYYLASCEGGFRARTLGDVHMVFTRATDVEAVG
jgi:cyclopropane-fatty-acyl-phospholipid synthase